MEEKVVAAQPQDTPKNATFRVLVGFRFHRILPKLEFPTTFPNNFGITIGDPRDPNTRYNVALI